jgi:ATP-dependent exoDNAse (exonuclease V) beta subunit
MTIPPLTIVPAGAGSGKTYRIQKQLADWVVGGQVAPDRIVAVTFTEAAASELKKRIRFALVDRGRIGDALRLEESYISTIHGFCMRILMEFAFEGGISPSPRLLNDDEEKFLIRRSLPRTGKADPVAAELKKFGYRYNNAKKTGPEDNFRRDILTLIGRLRSLGGKGEDPGLAPSAVALLRRVYGTPGDAASLDKALLGAVEVMLKRFPRDLSRDYPGNKTAAKEFKDDYRNLRRAGDPGEVASDWNLWAGLRKLRVTVRGGKLPPGYRESAEAVMEAAAQLHRHPGPLADAELFVSSLLEASRECLRIYGGEKRKACLVDYPDMIAGAHGILSGRPDVLEILKSRVDCMVIDEFQDTNPLQFSLLWKLHEAGVPALIVGDVKQSIMGFQNADPRLFRELEKRNPRACEPLTANWRASAPLMEWVNAVGEGLFGERYTRLAPKADFKSALAPLEVVEAPKSIREIRARASWTAVRIKQLLDDGRCEVWDKAAKRSRRIRGGDIALLCPTHKLVDAYAEVLRTLGIRTRILRDGWLGTPEVRLLYHALAYLADPDDRHAALYLAVTELGSHSLEEALGILRRGEKLDDPLLDRLEPLRTGAAVGTVDTLVADAIDALDLYGRVAAWPDAAQARANLLKFEDEAREFGEANRQVLLAGGYYGTGIKTFLAWLSAKVEKADSEEKADRQPEPRVLDEDAVTVATWHSSKGLEWPVVAVCGMHKKVEPRLPAISVTYDDFEELGDILGMARIEIVPSFAAEETNDAFLDHLRPEQEEEAKRLLYVALTRAREKVIVEWPSHLAKNDKTYYWHLLSGPAAMRVDKDAMEVGLTRFPCVVNPAEPSLAPSVAEAAGDPSAPLPVFGRRAVEYRPLPVGLTPETVTPSLLRGEEGAMGAAGGAAASGDMRGAGATHAADAAGLREESYALPLDVEMEVAGAERGLVLHRFFELASGLKGRAELFERATGMTLDGEAFSRLEAAASGFDRWLEGELHPLRVLREVPLLGLDERGSVVSGVLDLLVETAEGYWILDHKSDMVDDRSGRFKTYLPQLRSYADLVRKAFPGKPVLGVGIHWISYGSVMLLPEERIS